MMTKIPDFHKIKITVIEWLLFVNGLRVVQNLENKLNKIATLQKRRNDAVIGYT